jgi:hypothetical protein
MENGVTIPIGRSSGPGLSTGDGREYRNLVSGHDGIGGFGRIAVQPYAAVGQDSGEVRTELEHCCVEHIANRGTVNLGRFRSRGFAGLGKQQQSGHEPTVAVLH